MLKIEDFKFSSSSIDDFYKSNKPKVSSSGLLPSKMRVASKQDLNGFMKISKDTLIHVSQQDFWKLAQDSETGEYYIERLTDDTNGPVKG